MSIFWQVLLALIVFFGILQPLRESGAVHALLGGIFKVIAAPFRLLRRIPEKHLTFGRMLTYGLCLLALIILVGVADMALSVR